MRWPTFLLGVAASFGVGFALPRLAAPGPTPAGTAAPPRPAALEEAWRAHVAGRAQDLASKLATLTAEPPDDPRAQDEVRLLSALASGDAARLSALAEGGNVASRAVVAGAQRALARGVGGPALRRTWSARFVREFPDAWARAEVEAGLPR